MISAPGEATGAVIVAPSARTALLRLRPVVRVVLVPATMELLGNANWWLPRWLQRVIPRVRIDETPTDVEIPPEPEKELVGAGR